MKSSTKKILKWTGIVLGALLLIAVALGAYVYSLIPKVKGEPVPLQSELFQKPENPVAVEGKYIYKSAAELAAMIRNRKATSTAIVQEYLAFIKNTNYKTNAIVWLREKEALEEARLADEAVTRDDSLPPLHGVPITVKEHFWVKGLPTNINFNSFSPFVAPDDSELTKALKKSGAIILGNTNVPIMLGDYQVYGDIYPVGNNPYDLDRTPGGSTGGGAAALAAGFTTLELGSDMGGSISVPAVFCGVYGLRPTFGALNITEGTSPDTVTKFTRMALAVAGPLARTADDLELMWNALKEAKMDERFQQKIDWKPASGKGLGDYRIAWADEWKGTANTATANAEVKEKIHLLADSLKSRGAAVQKTTPENFDEIASTFLSVYASMMGEGQPWVMRKLAAMSMSAFDDGSAIFKGFYETMDNPSDEGWKKLTAKRDELTAQWEAFFREHDFLICPNSYGPTFKKCDPGTPIESDGSMVPYLHYIDFTYVFNTTGHPGIFIPMGLDKNGLPIGIQVVGALHSEPELIHFAKLLKGITPGFVKPKT